MANENLMGVLNDLIKINNDRVEGYEKAAGELPDDSQDLKSLFNRMAEESRNYKFDLEAKLKSLGGKEVTDTTNLGKIYRVWMDVKSTFTNDDRQTALDSCEYGEDAAQKAYESALSSDAEMDLEIRKMILDQKHALKNSHDLIKKYREENEMVKH